MSLKNESFKKRIILFSILVIFFELLNEIRHILPINNWILQFIHFLFIGGIIISCFVLLKGLNNTTKELRKSNEKLNNIFDTLDVAIWNHDTKTDMLLISSGIEKLYGRTLDEFYRDKELWRKVIYPEDLPQLADREQRIERKETVTSTYRIIRPDGEVRWIQDSGIPVFDFKGELVEFTSVLFDITDYKESEERYRSLVEMSPDIVAVISKSKIDYINEAGSKLVGGLNTTELIKMPVNKFIDSNTLSDIQKRIHENELEKRLEIQIIRLDGKKIDVELSIRQILYEGRIASQLVGRDITERKKIDKTIHNLAYYDALTGLPNRNMFKSYLNSMINSADETKCLAVLFLDLDRFKMINDTKGHSTGDELLRRVTHYLTNAVKSDGFVSRQGGDEFIILLENANRKKATEVAERILKQFHRPVKLEAGEFFITPSIGISMYPEDGMDEEVLTKRADTAMYLAKELGKNGYQFYAANLDHLASRKMELENGLRNALKQDQLTLQYQPQIDLKTGKIIGVEALLRWMHPELGMISPGEFIPVAEESGLIVPLGKWVLEKACKQHIDWKEAGLGSIQVAVNISVRQIQEEKFLEDIANIIERSGADPQFLDFEITESIMQNIEQSMIILKKLKELGIKISIDDFGKGYSSLSYLRHLPIDKIKIDKLFVDDIIQHSNQGSLVKTIIDMCHNLQFTVVAEGIEKEEQVQFLLDNDCNHGQGYYFFKPLKTEEIEPLLEKELIKVQ